MMQILMAKALFAEWIVLVFMVEVVGALAKMFCR